MILVKMNTIFICSVRIYNLSRKEPTGLVGEEESVRMAQHKVGGSCPAERHLTVSFRKLTADFLKAGLSAGV